MNNLYSKLGLGQQPTQDEIDPEFEDIYQDSFPMEEESDARMDSDPEAVLNDASASADLKKMAMQKVLDKYLKPKEE